MYINLSTIVLYLGLCLIAFDFSGGRRAQSSNGYWPSDSRGGAGENAQAEGARKKGERRKTCSAQERERG